MSTNRFKVTLSKRKGGGENGWYEEKDGLVISACDWLKFAVNKGTGWIRDYINGKGGTIMLEHKKNNIPHR